MEGEQCLCLLQTWWWLLDLRVLKTMTLEALTNRRKDKVQVTIPSLRPYKNVSSHTVSGAAKWCTNPLLKSLKLTACPPCKSSFKTHSKTAKSVQTHHWHQQPGYHPNSGAGPSCGSPVSLDSQCSDSSQHKGTVQEKRHQHMQAWPQQLGSTQRSCQRQHAGNNPNPPSVQLVWTQNFPTLH